VRYEPGVVGLDPVVLEGSIVRLEPLQRSHFDALCAVGCDPALWTLTVNNAGTQSGMRQWFDAALADAQRGSALPFATELVATGEVVGSTRFGNIDHKDRRAEIGWTFVAKPWQKQGVNVEAKYLMLRQAFEGWHLQRVEFKTDAINQQSRRALLAIGAVEEGTLRKHQLTWTSRTRDTVYYSVIDDDWPAVKQLLEGRLQRGGS
jgi:RimJ/RimL family protein N-acetyltransferase